MPTTRIRLCIILPNNHVDMINEIQTITYASYQNLLAVLYIIYVQHGIDIANKNITLLENGSNEEITMFNFNQHTDSLWISLLDWKNRARNGG
jgi:hypothetical protein